MGGWAGWYRLIPDISRPENCREQRLGPPNLIRQCQIFFYFSEAAGKMVG